MINIQCEEPWRREQAATASLGRPAWILAGAMAAIVLVGAIIAVIAAMQSGHKRAIRGWLSFNLDDPAHEIIEWEDPLTAETYYRQIYGRYRGDEPGAIVQVVRLRTRNRFGAWELREMGFLVRDGQDGQQVEQLYSTSDP
jgi:hypothetical protein